MLLMVNINPKKRLATMKSKAIDIYRYLIVVG
jgi:hypothetical protein